MRILIADDERNIRQSLAGYFSNAGFDTETAIDGLAARDLLGREAFDCLVLDLKMPRLDGLGVLGWLQDQGNEVPVVMISAFGEVSDAVEAMKLGARDYLVKPFDPEELLLRVRRIVEANHLAHRVEGDLRTAELGLRREFGLGKSEPMVQVEALVAKVAPTPATVLVTGESGTGKEVVARLIHQKSPRAPGPFVAINLGGIPETLIESELFGHEKGAFTGAVDRKKGIFELASAGTLFLDEIGDLPLHLQVKLLRVLQDRQVQRVGGTQLLPMDARIIAATNRPLEALIKENKFREDLYYRINVIRIELPPLRDRKADIPHLADLFVQRLNRELGRRIRGFTAEALDRLQNYPFPGNVRELENLVERACILSESDLIGPETLGDLGPNGENPARSVPGSPEGGLRKAEQEAIRQALARHSGNLAAVAAELGISVRTLYTKRKELDQNDS